MPYARPRPSKHAFAVKRGVAGLGLFTKTPIKKKDFVIEYWGDIISDEAAEKKGGKYLYDLDETTWTIDGTTRRNLARYINHSCKPNCEPEQDGKRIFIYANRAIPSGEELTYDYGKAYYSDAERKRDCRCGNH